MASSVPAVLDEENEEQLLEDEAEHLFAAEDRERIIYLIDARDASGMWDDGGPEEQKFALTIRSVIAHLKRLIRGGGTTRDWIGVTLFGDSGCRGVPALPLGKPTAERIERLEGLREAARSGGRAGVAKWIDEHTDPARTGTDAPSESALRNGLWSAQAQFENAAKSASRHVFRSVVAFSADAAPVPWSQFRACELLAGDCRDQNVEIRAALFAPALDKVRAAGIADSPWARLLAKNQQHMQETRVVIDTQTQDDESQQQQHQASSSTTWETALRDADKAVRAPLLAFDATKGDHSGASQSFATRRLAKGTALELVLDGESTPQGSDDTPLNVRCRRVEFVRRGVPPPATRKTDAKSGRLVTARTELTCALHGAPLTADEVRTYGDVGPDGRSYLSPAEKKRCGALPYDGPADGEVRIVGFTDALVDESLAFRSRPSVLVADDAALDKSSDALAALVGAMRRRGRVALGVVSERVAGGSRRNPQPVVLQPVVADGPPLPSGLLVRELAFRNEHDNAGALGAPPSRSGEESPANENNVPEDDSSDALAGAAASLVTTLAARCTPRRGPHTKSDDDDALGDALALPNPTVAAKWAAIEAHALSIVDEEDPAPMSLEDRYFPRPEALASDAAACRAALDALCGPEPDEAESRPSKRAKVVDTVPEALLATAKDVASAEFETRRRRWDREIRVYTKVALHAAAQQLDARDGKPVPKSYAKDKLIDLLATHLGWTVRPREAASEDEAAA